MRLVNISKISSSIWLTLDGNIEVNSSILKSGTLDESIWIESQLLFRGTRSSLSDIQWRWGYTTFCFTHRLQIHGSVFACTLPGSSQTISQPQFPAELGQCEWKKCPQVFEANLNRDGITIDNFLEILFSSKNLLIHAI